MVDVCVMLKTLREEDMFVEGFKRHRKRLEDITHTWTMPPGAKVEHESMCVNVCRCRDTNENVQAPSSMCIHTVDAHSIGNNTNLPLNIENPHMHVTTDNNIKQQ